MTPADELSEVEKEVNRQRTRLAMLTDMVREMEQAEWLRKTTLAIEILRLPDDSASDALRAAADAVLLEFLE